MTWKKGRKNNETYRKEAEKREMKMNKYYDQFFSIMKQNYLKGKEHDKSNI